MKKILLTYFLPFLDMKDNSSEEVGKLINEENIKKIALRVSYTNDVPTTVKELSRDNYDYIIMLGQARGRENITLEERAINLSNTKALDNEGIYPNEEIIEGYSHYLYTKIDIDSIIKEVALDKVAKSHNPGFYVCNFLYYNILYYLKDKSTKALFIHLPCFTGQVEDNHIPTINTNEMAKIVKKIIQTIVQID